MLNIKKIGKKVLKYFPENISILIKQIYYSQLLKNYSELKEPDFKVVKHLISSGDCALDIGANIGVYTKYLSQLVGNQGNVYSVEPIPVTFKSLSSNIRILKLINAKAFNYAISDTEGMVTMEVPNSDELYGENFYEAKIVYLNDDKNNCFRKFTVPAKTVDGLFSELQKKITFIKCDVEGHEAKVLKGAIQTIKKFKPAWLIEVAGNPDDLKSQAYETFSILRSFCYEPFYFNGEKLKLRQTGEKNINYFFLTKEHLIKLEKTGLI